MYWLYSYFYLLLNQASLNSSGHLIVNQHVDWIPLLRLASNCDEQNVEVCLAQYPGAVILRTTKPINESEELKVWFSSDLLVLLDLPFLTPKNIISHRIYKCTNCSKTFSQPNPLKVHLAYDCPITLATKTTAFAAPIYSDFKLIINGHHQQLMSDRFVANVQIANKPFLDSNNNSKSSNGKNSMPTKEPKTHVCVFCGKLYTRKYGLKIHLRTHTGHKPLSCRFCGRPFSDPSNLNKHIRLHAHHSHFSSLSSISSPPEVDMVNFSRNSSPSKVEISPYRCTFCGKVMMRQRDLERHVRSHHRIN